MDYNDFKAFSNSVYNQLCKALDLRRFKVEPVYNGKCFRVEGRGNDTNIYIRLEYREGMNCVNFSSISIDEKFQRTGVLTKLINYVSTSEFVDAIVIGGVCTKNMLAWCYKMGYSESNISSDYIKILKHKGAER